MKRTFAIALAGLTLGASGVTLAAQYPSVDFNSWTVTTIDGKKHEGIAPHSTFKHCKSNPAKRVTAIAEYQNAQPGVLYRDYWYVDDKLVSTAVFTFKHEHGHIRWHLSKRSGNPIPDGRYDLHVNTYSGHRFAATWIKLATKKKHGKPC